MRTLWVVEENTDDGWTPLPGRVSLTREGGRATLKDVREWNFRYLRGGSIGSVLVYRLAKYRAVKVD